ncbi:hypothetical protein [Acinetobacter haemolyticus]|uniref:hypothetical protein n=1 Tax=Acinetobacter haemolyticus TaxID=29430 RepID=UPI0014501448|nr:hypothetical protein [Acinetobacter haemolyticus]NAS00456.1 hypothetical protein [Acinetobacter haemolyticus]
MSYIFLSCTKQLDISESQYKDLLADIYDGITAYLKKDQDVLNLKHFSEIQTETV